MGIKEVVRKAFLEGYATGNLEVGAIMVCIVFAALIGAYIYVIYRNMNKNSFYNRNFNLSLMALAVITASVILTIQSNIVVSLGMVGALSIVRFRTAIKDPMDLVFLFWSISAGIICGAGYGVIAVIASLVLTVILVVFSMLPESKKYLVLVVNSASFEDEDGIMEVAEKNCGYVRVKARNVTRTGINLAVEVRPVNQKTLIKELMGLEGVLTASLVEYDGDVTV